MLTSRTALSMFSTALLVVLAAGSAGAYTTTTAATPTDLTIHMVLKSQPIHNNFTRYLVFEDLAGSTRSVGVAFTKTSPLVYDGVVTASGLTTLESLADFNDRSYWDVMRFENHGGSTALEIDSMLVEIEYANTCCGREEVAEIAYGTNKSLAAGTDSVNLSSQRGRRLYAQDYMGWSTGDFYALPAALRWFVYDIGKSGSSGAADSVSSTNPKYASSGSALCSETVSWYYYEHDEWVVDALYPWIVYTFRDITSHSVMHDQFKYADRLYCYHLGRQEWVKRDRSYNWVLSDTYVPQAGDYLDRRPTNPSSGDNGHAMMLVDWDANTGVATTLDGPYNINFRPVNVLAGEQGGTDYCVGRIPSND